MFLADTAWIHIKYFPDISFTYILLRIHPSEVQKQVSEAVFLWETQLSPSSEILSGNIFYVIMDVSAENI
jgi:hypothetical protein